MRSNCAIKALTPTFLILLNLIFFVHYARAQNNSTINLPEFKVKANEINVYNINRKGLFKTRNTNYIFSSSSTLPNGFDFSEDGVLAWYPTPKEFDRLRNSNTTLKILAVHPESEDSIMCAIRLAPDIQNQTPDATMVARDEDTSPDPSQENEPTTEPLKIQFPDFKDWNKKTEGEAFSFKLGATGGSGKYTFGIEKPTDIPVEFDPDGYFNWEPGYSFVTGDSDKRGIRIKFYVQDEADNKDSSEVELLVNNRNRAPTVNELPTFYVQYDKLNTFQLKLEGIVYDEDGDEIVFQPIMSELPQGMLLSKNGELRWKPSVSQFNKLRKNPLKIRFTVADIPYGAETQGVVRLEVTQQDLAPQITMVPDNENIEIKENEALNLGFFINDPNGQEDIALFDFVSENQAVIKTSLTKVSKMQYEFKWVPDFSFVEEKDGTIDFNITFFTLDKANNRAGKTVSVKVQDAENLAEKDRLRYFQYRTVLVKAFRLLEQLEDKEKELEKEYKKSKNGKRNRAITNASLGAITGLTPVFLDGQPQKVTVGIGGTATATIGSLEASNVLGKSPSDIMKKLSYVTSKKSEILLHGNIFAGTYAQKKDRRKSSFQNDLKNLTLKMNLQDMAKLELDASWQSSQEASNKNLKKVFQDFYIEEEYKGME